MAKCRDKKGEREREKERTVWESESQLVSRRDGTTEKEDMIAGIFEKNTMKEVDIRSTMA